MHDIFSNGTKKDFFFFFFKFFFFSFVSFDPTGAVFNLVCDERDEKLMSKIENHFGTHVAEVCYLITVLGS